MEHKDGAEILTSTFPSSVRGHCSMRYSSIVDLFVFFSRATEKYLSRARSHGIFFTLGELCSPDLQVNANVPEAIMTNTILHPDHLFATLPRSSQPILITPPIATHSPPANGNLESSMQSSRQRSAPSTSEPGDANSEHRRRPATAGHLTHLARAHY